MTKLPDDITPLANTVGDRAVYRRDVVKADGRPLRLYGYTPHEGEIGEQSNDPVAKGGELRFHPLRSEWNLYAPHRQDRTFKPSAADDPLAPTLPGGPVTEIPFADFELAIFENKFTSLHFDAPDPEVRPNLRTLTARGHCDVVVYTPEATGNLHSVGQDTRRLLLSAWCDRYETLFSKGCQFVMPFESRGDAVGVTLHHPHGQIYAFPYVPQVQLRAGKAFRDGYDLGAHMGEFLDDYGVAEAGGVHAFCPPYARFPFETYVTTQRRVAGPWEFTEGEADGFAHLLGDMTRRYDAHFEGPTAYMLTLHAAPVGYEDCWHFTAQFYPLLRAPGRVKYLASVEQGTGTFTVDVMPEMAAKTLRAL